MNSKSFSAINPVSRGVPVRHKETGQVAIVGELRNNGNFVLLEFFSFEEEVSMSFLKEAYEPIPKSWGAKALH